MARVILGMASSHGPTMRTPPEGWDRLEQKDRQDPRFDFQAVLRKASPDVERELAPEKKQQRYQACQRGIQRLREVLAEASPDAVVVVSNPHGIRDEEPQPVFALYIGDSIPRIERSIDFLQGRRSPREAAERTPGRQVGAYPANSGLATHLLESLIQEGFDVGCHIRFPPGQTLDGSFTAFYELYEPAGTLPMVPFMLSRYPPHEATANRCYDLGRTLRRAIESWATDSRVAIMASGGLSHQILDEEFDRRVIHALQEKDEGELRSLPRDRINGAPGTPEILNWVTLAAAMEREPVTLVDYVPCYRSAAGTGHGVTFAYWK